MTMNCGSCLAASNLFAHTLRRSKSARITPQWLISKAPALPMLAKPQSVRSLKTKLTSSTPLPLSPRTLLNRCLSFLD